MFKVNSSFRFPKPDQKDKKTHVVAIAAMVMGMQSVSCCDELMAVFGAIILSIAMFIGLKTVYKDLNDTEINCDCMLSYYVMKYFAGICIQSVLTLLILVIINTTG